MYVLDNGRWMKLGETGHAEMVVTTVATAGKGLPKLTGLKHELVDPNYYEKHRAEVEMQTYERMVHRPLSKTDPRNIPIIRKRVGVIKDRSMIEHLKQGRKLLEEKQTDISPDQYVELFTEILNYDVPGISRMTKDYTVLLNSKAPSQQPPSQELSFGYYNLAQSTNNAGQHKVETTTPVVQGTQDQGFSLPSIIAEQKG